MSNAKRILEKKAPKPAKEKRVKKLKFDMSLLPDAIVAGKVVVKPKTKIYFERLEGGSMKIHEGSMFDSDEKSATLWDETRGQFYLIDLSSPPVVKASSSSDLILV